MQARLSYSIPLSFSVSVWAVSTPVCSNQHPEPSDVCAVFFFWKHSSSCLLSRCLAFILPPLPSLIAASFSFDLLPVMQIFCQKCTIGLWLRIRVFWCRCGSCIVFKSTGWLRWHSSWEWDCWLIPEEAGMDPSGLWPSTPVSYVPGGPHGWPCLSVKTISCLTNGITLDYNSAHSPLGLLPTAGPGGLNDLVQGSRRSLWRGQEDIVLAACWTLLYIQMSHLLISSHRWQMSLPDHDKDPIKPQKLQWSSLNEQSQLTAFFSSFPFALTSFTHTPFMHVDRHKESGPLGRACLSKPAYRLYFFMWQRWQWRSGANSTCSI